MKLSLYGFQFVLQHLLLRGGALMKGSFTIVKGKPIEKLDPASHACDAKCGPTAKADRFDLANNWRNGNNAFKSFVVKF
jgi:hypothetical protein